MYAAEGGGWIYTAAAAAAGRVTQKLKEGAYDQ